MAIQEITINSGAADASGDATSTSASVYGKILAVAIVYDASSAAGTDVTLTGKIGNQSQTIVSLANANTTKVLYPRTYAQDTVDNDLTYDGTNEIPTPFVVHGSMTLTVADQTAGKAVKAYILVEV